MTSQEPQTPRTIVITGASDGIGAVSARQLHDAGERVVVVGRDPKKTAAVASALGVDSFTADYGDLEQVRTLAGTLLERYPGVDVLANNAGGIFAERAITSDGYEVTFQVNHLAPFLLTNLLRDRLIASGGAVIQTSSVAARRFARFDIDDLNATHRYSSQTAYGNAKLANVLFTKELHRRFGGTGMAAVAFHPGVIASNFAAGSHGMMRWLYTSALTAPLLTSTETGGARLTWLAMGTPGVDWESGGFYAKNRLARTHPLADEPALAQALWERSAEMVGITS